jgi:Fur family zinc uptake transcriptional regulator
MALHFEPGVVVQLDRADIACGARGAKLTDLRRQVLGLVLSSTKPAGAYDILNALREDHKGAAPPTVYRALDFLLEQGLVHKVESLSAFVGCAHDADHGHSHPATDHAAQFLICRTCGRATEFDNPDVLAALQKIADTVGFLVETSLVEAKGLCDNCR